MRWLITGGCGFIGRNLIRELLDSGETAIRVVDNFSVGTREDLARICPLQSTPHERIVALQEPGRPTVQLIEGDIVDEQLALQASAGVDAIVHLAAETVVPASVENPRKDCHVNILGTLNYLEAARHNGIKRFVFASSAAPIGNCEPPVHEDLAPRPISPYGASKLAGEAYCSVYYHTFGIETVALRFSNVFGPASSHKSSVVASFIRSALNGDTLHIFGNGLQTRDFIYVHDLVRAIQLAASVDGIGGEVFQVATNTETTLNDLAQTLVGILADRGIDGIGIVHDSERKGDVKRSFLDITKARFRLGWTPQTSLFKGLHETLDWFLQNNGIRSRLAAL
ncbi:MAG TPA: NAD-dependent epimerase/dehydratase family protein [Desulfomonilaceae bacterium]|nr:NAD-dependent epimerase/dehydratase family protein [Desulfomonilaceae bacterium]